METDKHTQANIGEHCLVLSSCRGVNTNLLHSVNRHLLWCTGAEKEHNNFVLNYMPDIAF